VCARAQTTFEVGDILATCPFGGGSFHIQSSAAELLPARRWRWTTEQNMSLGTILLIVLILILLGVLPTWPHARSWGYGPSGIVGVVLIVLIVLFLMGRL
jgi:hypothetical protein